MEEQRKLNDTQCERELAELGQITSFLSHTSRLRAAAMQAAQAGWWYWDVIKDELFWDPQMYVVYGRSEAKWSPNYGGFSNCIHPDDRDKVEAAIRACLNEGEEYFYRFRAIDDEGLIRHIEGRGDRICDDNGKAVAMAGVCIQIPSLVK